ncbi:MAG: 30S ribosomal protein S17 [Planctomycetota bacterium]
MTEERNNRKTVVGTVTSDKMAKTVTVKSERLVKHPRFLKYVKRYTTFHAHDETNDCRVGDTVELVECRPLSKIKRYRVINVVRRGKGHAPREGGQDS